ncbi:MAG: DUF2188 domain-containing protein [Tahibacter sp.]
MKRIIYHVVHKNADSRWHLEEAGGGDLSSHDSKGAAVEDGKARAKALHDQGTNAQLIIHRQDGSIETEHTYGDDPRQTPG